VARWDGTNWAGLIGPGLPDPTPPSSDTVFALAMFNGELIAGGDFGRLNSLNASTYAARWDGTTWRPLGDGLGGGFRGFFGGVFGSVSRLAEWQGKLYLGGIFTFPSGGVAGWDGTNTFPLPGLVDPDRERSPVVGSLVPVGDQLVAVGSFFIRGEGTNTARAIAGWNGANWLDIDGGRLPGTGQCVLGADGALYMASGAGLDLNSEVAANGLMRWDGTKASALHNGVLVEELQRYSAGGGESLAAGVRRRAVKLHVQDGDMVPVRRVGSPYSLLAHEGRILVFGRFDRAGAQPHVNIAEWQPAP
jgi:hypothetical protein